VAYFNRYVPEKLPRGSYADAQTFSGEMSIRKNGKVSHRSCTRECGARPISGLSGHKARYREPGAKPWQAQLSPFFSVEGSRFAIATKLRRGSNPDLSDGNARFCDGHVH
jgi:hypothetical protein